MSTAARYQGVIPPVVTPRTADGAIDVPALERVIAHLLDGGVSGLFVLGSSGEVPYLTDPERETVAKVAAATNAGQVPLIVGACAESTNRVIDEARRVRSLGADALVVTAPYYTLTNADEVDRHFRAVHAAVDLPLFAYDIPVRTHFKLPGNLLTSLGRDGVLAGVKDSSGDDVGFRQLLLDSRDIENFDVFTGHEVVVDGALLGGAAGVVPGLGNVDPAGYARLVAAAGRGDWQQARVEQDRLADLFRIVEAPNGRVSAGAAGLGAFKTALTLLGIIDTNLMSAPMERLNAAETKTVAAILERNGLL